MSIDDMFSLIQNGKVPSLSIALMVVSLIIVLVLFLGMPIYLVKFKKCKIRPFIFGCLVWFVFAGTIEALFHSLILRGNVATVITGNALLYALYGGVMAGLFEEGGRFVAMKYFLKKELDNDANAICYGAGHGGFEALYLLGFGMISNISTAVLINSGMFSASMEALKILPEDQLSASLSAMITLISSPSYIFIIGLFERFAAIAAHISLSVFVWFAVKKSKPVLWLAAFGLHFLLDAATLIINSFVSNLFILEACVYVIVAVIVFFAVKVYKNNTQTE